MTMRTLITLAAILVSTTASAEPVTTFRNSQGQIQGYATKHGNATTFENSQGQQTGRAERNRDGTVIYFDAKGRQIGSARR
jgi:hypothetical protein